MARLGEPAVARLRDLPHGHFAPLDALRGFAVLLVVIRDAGLDDMTWRHENALVRVGHVAMSILESWGWIGLQCFLVFAGFLVTKTLLEGRDDAGAARRFAIRRALSTVPLYYLTIFVVAILVPRVVAISAESAQRLHAQIWYWTFLCNWVQPFGIVIGSLAQCWSLAVEEQFCVLWVPLVYWLTPRRLVGLCVALIVIAFGVRVAIIRPDMPLHEMPVKAYQLTICRIDALAWGSLLAIALRDESMSARLARLPLAWIWAPIGVLAASALLDIKLRWGPAAAHTVGQSSLAILFTMLIAFSATDRFAAFFRSRVLVVCGELGFGLYLFHLPLKNATMDYAARIVAPLGGAQQLAGRIVYTLLLISASAILAIVAAYAAQKPLGRLKDRYAPMTKAHS